MVMDRFSTFKTILSDTVNLMRGWKTNRQIIVFESDDWGSLRMPSSKAHDILISKGLSLEGHYNKFDSLESTNDLRLLFDLLSSHKDCYGHHPVISANFLVANPDFKRIKESDFKIYQREIFTETYKYFKECERSFAELQKGILENLISPQFHGREHLNVNLWMHALQTNHYETVIAFDNKFWALRPSGSNRRHYLSAYDFKSRIELISIEDIISDGLEIFNNVFGFKAQTFVATNYTWHPAIEKTLFKSGIRHIQGLRWQLIPIEGEDRLSKKWRVTGLFNPSGLLNLVRNSHFEPSESPSQDWIRICLSGISKAFYWKKPAIVSMHRVNFMGSLNSANRERNLRLFDSLLKEIKHRWPRVEYMTSDKLGHTIMNINENGIRP